MIRKRYAVVVVSLYLGETSRPRPMLHERPLSPRQRAYSGTKARLVRYGVLELTLEGDGREERLIHQRLVHGAIQTPSTRGDGHTFAEARDLADICQADADSQAWRAARKQETVRQERQYEPVTLKAAPSGRLRETPAQRDARKKAERRMASFDTRLSRLRSAA